MTWICPSNQPHSRACFPKKAIKMPPTNFQKGCQGKFNDNFSQYVRPTTREVVLDSCPESYYNININLGEKGEEKKKKIEKFVLRHFKSITVHLVGRLHQVHDLTNCDFKISLPLSFYEHLSFNPLRAFRVFISL